MAHSIHPAALVTGASAGIGRAFAVELARQGYNLVLVARRVQRLEELAADLRARFGVQAEPLPADLSTEEGIARVEQRITQGGDIDFLVNDAGYDEFGTFAEIPIERSLGLINCLEIASVRLTRAALPAMLRRRRGAVINVSSIGAFTAKRKDSTYVASKAFINRFTESLALELGDSGVRALAVCPGFTWTEFHDAPEYAPYRIKERVPRWLWMEPESVVRAALRALGEGQAVCVPGLRNQAIAFLQGSGFSQSLMRVLASFFPDQRKAQALPAGALDLLACPGCRGKLELMGTAQEGWLSCPSCGKRYPDQGGIPRFASYEELSGLNRRFAGLYDWFSIIYRLFSTTAFALIGTSEDEARGAIMERLEPRGRVLEVSIGPGVNLPYLREYPLVEEIYGLDLSLGQLARCQRYAQHRDWPVALFQGNAEKLPFGDETFDSVFHMGGINFFNDKQKAIAEMIRVARPGTKIVIIDENERGAREYERTLPGFKRSFPERRELVKAPLQLVPAEMEEIRLDENFWKGWFYCLEFRKPRRG